MEVTGKIKLIGETQRFGSSDKPFTKREFVITTDETYPQHISMEFVQDKCALLDNYAVGKDVKVSINLRGREWINPQGEAKYFNTIQAWRIEDLSGSAQPSNTPTPDLSGSEESDLPF